MTSYFQSGGLAQWECVQARWIYLSYDVLNFKGTKWHNVGHLAQDFPNNRNRHSQDGTVVLCVIQ